MDAVKFLKEKGRMCNSAKSCIECPLSRSVNKHDISCVKFCKYYPEEAVAIVKKWSVEHPVKTRMTDFLEKYPDALMDPDGTPKTCCMSLGYCDACIMQCSKCWNTPVE